MTASLLAASSAPVRAQSDDTLMLMNRLNDLDARVQALSQQAGQGSAVQPGGPVPLAPAIGGAGAADMDVRLQQMQDQIRSLTGEVESQGNEIAQLKTENQRMLQDMQMRLNDLEAKVGGGPATGAAAQAGASEAGASQGAGSMYGPGEGEDKPTPPAGGTLGTLVPGPNGSVPAGSAGAGSPEKDYEAAYNLLGSGDYAGAEAGFSAFLRQYPKQALAPNAEFWLGETYYVRGMMDKAAATYAETYRQYPNGAKAPDALLKLGMSLGRQGKAKQACLTFAELGKQFPAASSKIKSTAAEERARFKCQ